MSTTETLNPFSSDTVLYQPSAGEVCTTRSVEDLHAGAEYLGFDLEETQFGFRAITEQHDSLMYVSHWDKLGRLVCTDFINVVVTEEPDSTPIFSNVYSYDEIGRLIRDEQVYIQRDGSERLFRGSRYEYPEGRLDKNYNEIFVDVDGLAKTVSPKKRRSQMVDNRDQDR